MLLVVQVGVGVVVGEPQDENGYECMEYSYSCLG